MERAVETQRLKLLRLLAGWLAVVAFLSAAPISPAWTLWVRSFLSSVLARAEAAAQCLIFVEARRIAQARGGEVDPAWLSQRHFELLSVCDGTPPSLAVLRRRLVALRGLLNSLPRRGLRLLRRMTAGYDADGVSDQDAPEARRRLDGMAANSQWCPQTVWHPPEAGLPIRI